MKTPLPVRRALVVLHRLVRLPWAMIHHHGFFCRESLKYSGKSLTIAPFQVSRAWLRFMWFGLCDECSIIRMKMTDPMEDRKANVNVDLPDTAAQDSASPSNNPAASG